MFISHRMISKTNKTFKTENYDSAVSEYGEYVDKSPCPWSMLAVFLWNWHMQMLHTSFVWAWRFSAFEITTLKRIGGGGGRRVRGGGGVGGVGGARNGKDRVFVFKTLWNRSFKVGLSLRIIHKNYEKSICFRSVIFTISRMHFRKKKHLRAKEGWIGVLYGLHHGLHLLKCTFTLSVV